VTSVRDRPRVAAAAATGPSAAAIEAATVAPDVPVGGERGGRRFPEA